MNVIVHNQVHIASLKGLHLSDRKIVVPLNYLLEDMWYTLRFMQWLIITALAIFIYSVF